MIFVYASLGIAMFTAIGMINKTGISILTQGLNYDSKNDEYLNSKFKTNDMNFLKLLKEADSEWGENNPLCTKIIQEIKANTKYISLEKYQLADKSESDNEIFIGSCTLQENNLQGNKHRVLIIKSDSEYTKYSLFSCLTKDSRCNFEL